MERILTCPSCTVLFDIDHNIPYLLLCGHSLCKTCLQEKLESAKKTFNCQTCNKVQELKDREISEYPVNQYIIAVLRDRASYGSGLDYNQNSLPSYESLQAEGFGFAQCSGPVVNEKVPEVQHCARRCLQYGKEFSGCVAKPGMDYLEHLEISRYENLFYTPCTLLG